MIVTNPADMNHSFARAFNSGDIDAVLSLYEPDAVLRVDHTGTDITGVACIAEAIASLRELGGTMTSTNNFCVRHGDLAVLRADWVLNDADGAVVLQGSSAEVLRRQADGTWKMIVDHAVGASLPRVDTRIEAPCHAG